MTKAAGRAWRVLQNSVRTGIHPILLPGGVKRPFLGWCQRVRLSNIDDDAVPEHRVGACEPRTVNGWFDSHGDAMVNNELEVTQEASADNNAGLGDVAFRDLDVFEIFEL